MTVDDIDNIMARQSELIAALDAQDAAAITLASEALAAAVAQGRNSVASLHTVEMSERIGVALQHSKAAAMRANTLLHWTRQRIGKIADLRGIPTSGIPINY